MMKTIIARRMKEKRPFYMACLDISKAYDTVDHQRLWQICESLGITGTWLDNVRELYTNTHIRAIGTEGKMEGVKTVRGIKQGCPMSPLLFAIYVQTVATALGEVLEPKEDEPNMLMYADDMVLWADSEEELKLKLSKVLDTMNALGLCVNGQKTELQHNKWRIPSCEGKSFTIGSGINKTNMNYLNINKPIRYLGAWTTASNDTTHGLEMLKEKLQSRLEDIQASPASALHKVMLAKGRMMSVWNYTAGIQDISVEFAQEWDIKVYRAITSKEFGATSRKDLIYEPVVKGGMGMQSLVDLYKVNRCRVLAQVMEAAKRQRGRGQVPWVEKMMMNELNKPEQCMKIYTEIRDILTEMGLAIVRNPNTDGMWKIQRGGKELVVRDELVKDDEYMQDKGKVNITGLTLDLQECKVPHRLLEWYVKGENMAIMEATDRAVHRQSYKIKTLLGMGYGKSEANKEMGLRLATIHSLEREFRREGSRGGGNSRGNFV